MTNNYYNYVRNLLTIFAAFFVFGNAGATDVNFDVKDGNASQYSSYLGQTVNVTLQNRTFVAYEWTGVCFPFSANKEQLDAAFGEGKYVIEQFTGFSETTISFKIMEEPAVVAGTPYIIRVTETKENPVFSGVTFASTLDNDNTNFGSQNDNCHINIAEDLTFRGYYFKKDEYRLVGGQSTPATAYWIKTNGSLINLRVWPGSDEFPGTYYGTGAYFSSQNLGNTMLTLQLEQPASSGESGEGGEIDLSTLAGKIAARAQLTNLPTIYLTIPDVHDIDNDLKKIRQGYGQDIADYHQATIQVVDDETKEGHLENFTDNHLQIKVRGNSTSAPSKRPYRLKFDKDEKDPVTGEKTGVSYKRDLMGGGYKKRNWVLFANAADHSMIRNALTSELCKIIGLPFVPGYKFVDLVINNEYRGTYQVTDQPEVDKKRINIDEDTGWYVEFQGLTTMLDLPYQESMTGVPYYNIKNPDYDLDSPELATLKTEMANWFDKWKTGFQESKYQSESTGWRAYNDEETLLKYILGTEITADYDGFMSTKVYREVDGKLCWGPVWDKDLAWGNYGDYETTLAASIGTSILKYYFYNDNGSFLYKDPRFTKRMRDRLKELIDGGLEQTLNNKIDDLSELIKESYELNYSMRPNNYCNRWNITDNLIGEKYSSYTTQADYKSQLKSFIGTRLAWLMTKFQELYEAANPNGETVVAATYNPEEYTYGYNLTSGSYVNETVSSRTLTANKWNVFSLPFSATQSQVEAAFGCSYELCVHTGMDTDGETMIFNAPSSKDIVSGIPYLIKPASNVTNPVFSNVINTEFPFATASYNGATVTFDNEHFFCASIFSNSAGTQNADYRFTDDIYEDANSLVATTTNDVIKGARAFIRVTDNQTVKVRIVESAPPVVRTQKSDVPTIYIDTQDNAEIQPSTGLFVPAAIEVLDKDNLIGDFTETSAFMEIRGRNKTEWSDNTITKKSYRLKFAKDEKDEAGNITTTHKHDLTGGGYAKRNWILVANAADESMVRNALADELGKAMGFEFTPNYQFVDLYINNEYKGTYMATDHVEADKEGDVTRRVPVDEKQGWLLDMVTADGIATGDIYVEGSDSYPYINIKNPEPGKKTGTEEEIKARVKTFFYALWAADNATGLDKASFVNWYIATEILGNASALTAIYAYKENDAEELKFGPLWGNELAFGASTAIDMSDLKTPNSYTGMVYQSATASAWKTKLQALWQKNWFKQAVKERWAEIYNSGTDDIKSTMLTKFNEVETAINKADQKPTEAQLNVISTYLGERFEYLNTKFAELTVINGPVVTIGAGGYGSFSWPQALNFSDTDVEVYIATNRHDNSMQLKQLIDGKVPANEGIIVKGTTGTTVFPETTTETITLPATNLLSGTASDTYTSQEDIYALGTKNGITGFYKVRSGAIVPLHKAYYKPASNSPQAIFFSFGEVDATGIDEVSVKADEDNGEVFDLQGRRIKGNLAKGIYIKNGKKFIVK